MSILIFWMSANQGFFAIKSSGACALGWLPDKNYTSCYYVSNTTDPSQLLIWDDAYAKCQGMLDGLSKQPLGAHLLTIDGANDQVTNTTTMKRMIVIMIKK